MDIIFDTNVILDDILHQAPNVSDAAKAVNLVTDNIINGYITANSITDIYYIARKKHNNETTKEIIKNLLLNFCILSIDGHNCLDALELPINDFEDALVVVCAKNANIDYILTSDKEFLHEALPIPTMTPTDFLAKLASSN